MCAGLDYPAKFSGLLISKPTFVGIETVAAPASVQAALQYVRLRPNLLGGPLGEAELPFQFMLHCHRGVEAFKDGEDHRVNLEQPASRLNQ